MITLTDRLRKLINPRKRGKGRLPPPEDLGALLGGRGIGKPQAVEGATGAGLRPPFDEQDNARQFYPESSWTSSDGFFVIVRANIRVTEFRDQDDTPIIVNYVDETYGT